MAESPLEDGFAVINLDVRDLPQPHSREYCGQCTATDGYLARYIKSNGAVALRWVCGWCEDYTTSTDLPHTFLEPFGVTVDQLPKIKDSSNDPSYWPECCVCDSPGEETHHWAPRSIFPDWPEQVAILCTIHHREWHERMRAHGLRWPHEIVPA